MWYKNSSWLSSNFLLQSSDGTSKPELQDTWHETAAELLQPEEELNPTGVNQVGLGLHRHNLSQYSFSVLL